MSIRGIYAVLSAVLLTVMLTGLPVPGFAQVQTMDLSAQDRQFMSQAAQGNLAEIWMGRLALDKTSDPQVRAMAESMVEEHTAAQSRLQEIANDYGVVLPIEPDAQQQAAYNQLQTLSGQAFDMAYLQQMKLSHERAIALYQMQLTRGTEPRLTGFASSVMPTLQTHLASVEQLIIAMQTPSQRQAVRGFW